MYHKRNQNYGDSMEAVTTTRNNDQNYASLKKMPVSKKKLYLQLM